MVTTLAPVQEAGHSLLPKVYSETWEKDTRLPNIGLLPLSDEEVAALGLPPSTRGHSGSRGKSLYVTVEQGDPTQKRHPVTTTAPVDSTPVTSLPPEIRRGSMDGAEDQGVDILVYQSHPSELPGQVQMSTYWTRVSGVTLSSGPPPTKGTVSTFILLTLRDT